MIKIYIANLGAYTRGYLVGEWITLPTSSDSIDKCIENVLNGKEARQTRHPLEGDDEEVAIHDYQSTIEGLEIGEYTNIKELNEIVERLEKLTEEQQLVFGLINEEYELEKALDKVENEYYNILYKVENTFDLGYEIVQAGLFEIEVPQNLIGYLDYDSIGTEYECNGWGIYHQHDVAIKLW